MKGRGQSYFVKLPRLGATFYDGLMQGLPMRLHYKEVAQDLVPRIGQGRLLDVGTGPGRLLIEVHALNPTVELFGLDISEAMLRRARRNLRAIEVDLRRGGIGQTDYPGDYFDAVTCTGSFYLWDHPEEGLEDIHRVLKPGRAAYLYECRRDYDEDAFRRGLRENLRHLNLISRIIGPLAIRQALRAAYLPGEIADIIGRTSFRGKFSIDHITLSGLPIWVRVELRKM